MPPSSALSLSPEAPGAVPPTLVIDFAICALLAVAIVGLMLLAL